MTDLSIVIPTRDARALVLGCLASVARAVSAAAARGIAAEILVVDDASRDGSAEAVAERFPGALRERLPAPRGFAGACNAGLRRMRGRHALLLNSDARLEPGILERCVAHLDAHPDVGLLSPQLVHPDGRLQRTAHGFPSLVSELVPRPALSALSPRRHPPKRRFRDALDVPALTGAALFARGEFLRDVGPLPEEYFFFLEETAWCWRARRAGWRVVLLPSARVVHLQGGSSKRVDPARTRIEYHRSLYRFYREHRGIRAMLLAARLRAAKSLFYVVTRAPLCAAGPQPRARWRAQREVLRWHLAGRPEDAGLRGLGREGAAARAAGSPA